MNSFIHDFMTFFTGIGKLPYLYLTLYLFLLAIYGVLWYFKRPVIKTLRKWEVVPHMLLAVVIWVFSFLFMFIIYVPPVSEPTKYTPEIMTVLPWTLTVVFVVHIMYFIVQWLIVIRKNIPGDI